VLPGRPARPARPASSRQLSAAACASRDRMSQNGSCGLAHHGLQTRVPAPLWSSGQWARFTSAGCSGPGALVEFPKGLCDRRLRFGRAQARPAHPTPRIRICSGRSVHEADRTTRTTACSPASDRLMDRMAPTNTSVTTGGSAHCFPKAPRRTSDEGRQRALRAKGAEVGEWRSDAEDARLRQLIEIARQEEARGGLSMPRRNELSADEWVQRLSQGDI
jgi:hypothetical protein